MLAYLGGVVSVISRPVPHTWDVPLEYSRAVFYLSRLSLALGTQIVTPPFSRRRSLSPTLNALSSTAGVSSISRFQSVFDFQAACSIYQVHAVFQKRGDAQSIYLCCNSFAPLDPPRDQLHGTSYNLSINTHHHKVCSHYAISG